MGLLALLSQACNIGEGLADLGDSLLDPDAALLDRPGRKLVSGTYQRLLIDGSLDDGGYVLALRTDTSDQRLAIVPFLKGDSCEVKSTVAFERLSSRVDVALDGLVAVQVSGDVNGKGTIRFVDFTCQERMPALDNASLPRIEFPTSAPRGLLTLTGEGKLYLANAETKKLEPVASDVTLAKVTDDQLFSVEKGKLVVRGDDLVAIATLGDGVVDFSPTGGTPTVVFQDSKGLHVWSEKDGTRTLAADGCAGFPLDTASIAYYSPCASRTVMLDMPGSKVGSKAARVTVKGPNDGLALSSMVLSYGLGQSDTTLLSITGTDASATSGDLVLGRLSPKDAAATDTSAFTTKTLAQDASLRGPGAIYLHWDGSKGDVVELDDKDSLIPIATGVAQMPGGSPYSPEGVLVRFDGKLGDLVQLTRSGTTITEKLLAHDVPVQLQAVETDGDDVAFVMNYDGSAGEVGLSHGKKVLNVAPRALKDTLRFLAQPKAVAYLEPKSSGDGAELHAYLTESGLDLLIHATVSEYRAVPWPSPGILYAVPSGDDKGIWFSKAR